MIAPLAKALDWSALQVWFGIGALFMRRRSSDGPFPPVEDAVRFLRGPNFLPAESRPAQLEFDGDPAEARYFRFPTPQPGEFAENNVVYGRLYRCSEHWQQQPTLVLLHGGTALTGYRLMFPLVAGRCNRAGFNVATLVAPYHFQRRPRRLRRNKGYLGFAESIAQAVAEVRALTGWLLQEGCPALVLCGFSYGGWLAGAATCCDARITAVVLTIPFVRMELSVAERVIWRRVREAYQGQRAAYEALNTTRLNLTLSQPAIPKENILLIEAAYGAFASAEPVEELWSAWGRPDIWRLPYGDVGIGMGFVPSLTGRVLRWLAPRLNQPIKTA
jgi:pimeloyl-ACP methyl ester carboxylesterase